jgi:hypothetical protein
VNHRPKTNADLWICWWTVPVFYGVFGLIFFALTRVMPPPKPDLSTEQIVAFFAEHGLTIQLGFGLLMIVIGFAGMVNGLVAYQMKRMSVSPAFAYGYIASLAVGAVPGCLFAAFSFLTATFRPERDPELIALLYDMGLLSFVGSLGCFSTQYLILAIAILLDKNEIFPKWMAYVSLWQIVTELVAAPVWIFKDGAFAWDGSISFWMGTAIFGVYQTCMIVLLRQAIERQSETTA